MSWLEKFTQIFGGKGYRTYVAAAVAACVAFNDVVQLIDPNTMNLLLALAAALGFYAADESPHDTPASS